MSTTKQIEKTRSLLEVNEELRELALLYLWREKQTETEKRHGRSVHNNGVGFSRWDSERFSRIASMLANGKTIGQYDREYLEHRLPKYCRQIAPVITELQEKLSKKRIKIKVEVAPKKIEQPQQLTLNV